MKRLLWLFVFLAGSRVSFAVDSDKGFWCAIHVHSTYSDGSYTPAQIKQKLVAAGIPCVIFTDHFSCFDGRGKTHGTKGYVDNRDLLSKIMRPGGHKHSAENPFSAYLDAVGALNEPGRFVAIAGTEYGFGDCHFNLISPTSAGGWKNHLKAQNIRALIDSANAQEGIIIFNHPHTCPGINKLLNGDYSGLTAFEVMHPAEPDMSAALTGNYIFRAGAEEFVNTVKFTVRTFGGFQLN